MASKDRQGIPELAAPGFRRRKKKALGKLGSQGGLGFLVSAESDWTSVDRTSVPSRTLTRGIIAIREVNFPANRPHLLPAMKPANAPERYECLRLNQGLVFTRRSIDGGRV